MDAALWRTLIDRLISSDSHITEPPDLWATRLPKNLRERGPRLVTEETGDWWHVDGIKFFPIVGQNPGMRPNKTEARKAPRFVDVVQGAYVPQKKLEAMDTDGVWGEVAYPSLGIPLWRLPDPSLLSACCAAYNDWAAEFAGAVPHRVRCVAMVNLDDVDEGVRELERAAKLGLVGAMISVYPNADRSYDRPMYDRFWAAAAEMQMPLSLHTGTNRSVPQLGGKTRDSTFSTLNTIQGPADYIAMPHWFQISVAQMIFAGVFERYPRLQVVSLEHEAAWAPHFIKLMDYTYTERFYRQDWHRFQGQKLPSDFFHQSVYISFQEDNLAIQMRHAIGAGNLMWGSDYPHGEGTFPRSREVLGQILQGVPDSERAMFTGGNAARVYRFK